MENSIGSFEQTWGEPYDNGNKYYQQGYQACDAHWREKIRLPTLI
jgi:hypothetical protein